MELHPPDPTEPCPDAAPPAPTERLFVDVHGVEWEVYDESGSCALLLDWDHLPQSNPGLIFVSRVDRRRIWPCPPDWQASTDLELEALCAKARSLL